MTRHALLDAGWKHMPQAGWGSLSVPGAPDGYFAMYKRFGSKRFADLVEPAACYAEQGFAVGQKIAQFWAWAHRNCGSQDIHLVKGKLRAGLFPFYVLLALCSIAPLAVVLGLGIFGVFNQSAKSVAYRNVRNPANLGPFLYLSLVAAAIFDWILYDQVPNAETLLGGALILASALTILFGTLMRHRISHETLPRSIGRPFSS